ncbi:MAG: glycine--tRNA ligase subunit beta [Rhodobacterales bacterium]|nr:MAG: glycine--tRNA ligase subunit beta [Rhodobacterales bacterium]
MDLLIELFSEEIPARMQARAAEDLKKLVCQGLGEAGLQFDSADAYSTPRRLVLSVAGLPPMSPDTREERKGPKVGAPEKAIEGFLRGAGVAREALEERDTPKGAVYFAVIEKQGRDTAEIAAEALEAAVRGFPWPKSMRWGAGNLRWVRPLHSILAILSDAAGTRALPLEIDGIKAGATTRGHRFMAPDAFEVTGFAKYRAKLAEAFVVLDAGERAEKIWTDATAAAEAVGLEVVEDKGLLAEIAGLVEYPVVLMGDIADTFLSLPPEVLQTSMKEHQKFLSVKNPATGRIEKFITVANRTTADNGATILAGNQKVLFARLADAQFFWLNDIREAEAGGAKWIAALENVTFHNKLGTQAARISRIAALARDLAPALGVAPDLAEEAARWAKVDLSSEMVYEFPELQGLMGRYYAGPAGHPAEVANAAEQHYQPLGPSDDVPSEKVSAAVALADKLDTLTGFWAIDEKPTGSKDPFALRRAALGVIRIVLEHGLHLKLDRYIDAQLVRIEGETNAALPDADARSLLDEIADHGVFGAAFRTVAERLSDPSEAFAALEKRVPDLSDDLLTFFHDRLKVHLKGEGLRHDVIDACLHMEGANDDLTLLVHRARALGEVMDTEEGQNLLQGFKRANNILSQAEAADGVEYSYGAELKFAEAEEEKALFAALDTAEASIAPALETEDFATAMAAMASLRAPIDAFFEAVQINSDNQVVRRNRLNLLARIRDICLSVADLSRVEG